MWKRFPLFVNIVALAGFSMLLPALHAAWIGDFATGRLMLYLSCLTLVGCVCIGLTLSNRVAKLGPRDQLLTVITGLAILPLLLAVPFPVLIPSTGWLNAYFEMVSSLTTTGATVFRDPEAVPVSLHLWRGIVGWLGGYITLVIAFGVMAPLNIGGFEMTRAIGGAEAERHAEQQDHAQDRLLRVIQMVTGPYVFISAALVFLLVLLGADGLRAVMVAMAVVSTSGILPDGNTLAGQGHLITEIIIAVFVLLSVTSLLFDPTRRKTIGGLRQDPELRLLTVMVIMIPGIMLIHFSLNGFAAGTANSLADIIYAVWGAVFTVLSFIATLGHQSSAWDSTQSLFGFETSGLLFLGLLAIGGGVASTAGGIKLLRIYALYKHGVREMERLTLPNSVAGAGQTQRRIRREGAFIAWVYLMLFLLSLAAAILALSLSGIDLIYAIELGLVMLANAGPALEFISQNPLHISELSAAAKITLCVTMIAGRLEVLALFAIFDPSFWRR